MIGLEGTFLVLFSMALAVQSKSHATTTSASVIKKGSLEISLDNVIARILPIVEESPKAIEKPYSIISEHYHPETLYPKQPRHTLSDTSFKDSSTPFKVHKHDLQKYKHDARHVYASENLPNTMENYNSSTTKISTVKLQNYQNEEATYGLLKDNDDYKKEEEPILMDEAEVMVIPNNLYRKINEVINEERETRVPGIRRYKKTRKETILTQKEYLEKGDHAETRDTFRHRFNLDNKGIPKTQKDDELRNYLCLPGQYYKARVRGMRCNCYLECDNGYIYYKKCGRANRFDSKRRKCNFFAFVRCGRYNDVPEAPLTTTMRTIPTTRTSTTTTTTTMRTIPTTTTTTTMRTIPTTTTSTTTTSTTTTTTTTPITTTTTTPITTTPSTIVSTTTTPSTIVSTTTTPNTTISTTTTPSTTTTTSSTTTSTTTTSSTTTSTTTTPSTTISTTTTSSTTSSINPIPTTPTTITTRTTTTTPTTAPDANTTSPNTTFTTKTPFLRTTPASSRATFTTTPRTTFISTTSISTTTTNRTTTTTPPATTITSTNLTTLTNKTTDSSNPTVHQSSWSTAKSTTNSSFITNTDEISFTTKASTLVPKPTQQASVICLQNQNFKFPDPENCRMYYHCNNGVISHLLCLPHFYFDKDSKDCVFYWWQKCPDSSPL